MKKFLVVLLACALIFGFAATASAADTQIKEFSDIADQSQAAQNAIMKLAILGVVEGNEGIGGSYRPADNLTRAEFAKIVCYLTGNVKSAEALANVGSKFPDVQVGSWYTGWINMAVQAGYFQGDTSGNFRPNANITMNEVVTVALRAAGYTDKLPGTWPANYALKAQNVGLLDDVTFVGSAAATRADMALICNETLGINMVVHISNEIAFALALSDGTVDPDGFSEMYYITNEQSLKMEETILHKAFDGQYYYVLVNQTELPTGDRINDEPKAEYFDESNGWAYEDYDSGEITINIYDSISYEDDDFDDYYYKNNVDDPRPYNVADSLASTYYLAGNYELTDLSGMQVQVLVIDGKEINYIEPYSSYVLAKSIYRNSASNIVADGKTYRASTTMDVGGKVSDKVYDADVKAVIDLTEGALYGADGIQNLYNSSSDDDFPGKIYLDKDGRVYATKNYNAYNEIPFGIVDELDNDVVLKAQTSNWKTTGSAGSNTNYTLDTDEPYVLYKDGELIKAEDLAENDVITYLGDNGGHFYYVSSPTEGEFTQQTSTKLTVGGYGYRQVAEFHISDDGGVDFEEYKGFKDDPIDTASFGDSEIAIAYNFSRIDYIALNTASSKIIGVVTDADPDSVWDGSFLPQYKKLTIYNGEGKEITYTFTTNFRNAYNSYLDTEEWVHTSYSNTSSATGKFYNDYFSGDKSLEALTGPIKEGDIVQVTLDSSDNIKKLSNYVAFDGTAADTKVEAVVKASTNRITLTGNDAVGTKGVLKTLNGAYTLPSDAIVFNVTSDGGDYDDVSLKTVASTLSADFKAAKIVAFDKKSNGNINYLYILEGVSAYKFGIISGQGRDSTDDYYTINGTRVYNDGARADNMPNLIAYNISGGDAKIVLPILAQRISGTNIQYLADMDKIVYNLDNDYGVAVGEVDSYSSSTNALNVAGQMLYITSDTFMYDFPADDDISSASSLRGKFVAAIYNDDFEVICVALLANEKDETNLTSGWKNLNASNYYADFVEADTTLTAITITELNLQVAITGADSDDESVVTADVIGGQIVLTSVAPGSAIITVTDGTREAEIEVTVNADGTITVGDISPFFSETPENVSYASLGLGGLVVRSAVSSDTDVATASFDGANVVITPVSEGSARITVTTSFGIVAYIDVVVDDMGNVTATPDAYVALSTVRLSDLVGATELNTQPKFDELSTESKYIPVIGAGLVYDVTVADGSTAGWIEGSGVNAGDKKFDDETAIFKIILTAKSGMDFTGTDITVTSLKNIFDKATTVVRDLTSGDTVCTITLTYDVELLVIANADLGAFTDIGAAPADGETPDAQLPAIAAAVGIHGASAPAASPWTGLTDPGGEFEEGVTATYTITLTPATGYTFTGTGITGANLTTTGKFETGTPSVTATPDADGKLVIVLTYVPTA